MLRCLLGLGLFFALPVSAADADTDPPAGICADLERLASELDEALICLARNDLLRTEVHQYIADLRFLAIRCANDGFEVEADRISEWATRLEHADTNRSALRAIHDEMTFRLDVLRLRRTIETIHARQFYLRRAIDELRWEYRPHYDQGRKEPAIGEVPLLLVVPPNSTVKVRHRVLWKQYEDDTFLIELISSSSEVVVPAEIKLEFEKHQSEFEYEVRVGAPGDYSIRLIPVVGQPVLVSISVK